MYICVQSVEGRKEWDRTKALIEASDIGTDYERIVQPEDLHPREFFLDVLQQMYESGEEVCVRFEDDLSGVNRHIRHNIERWEALKDQRFALGWLMAPGGIHKYDVWHRGHMHMSVGVVVLRQDIPDLIVGAAQYFEENPGDSLPQDIAITDAALRVLNREVCIHSPSLVRHDEWGTSLLGNVHHVMHDTDYGSFNEDFKRD